MAIIEIIDDDAPSRDLLVAILGYLGYGGHEVVEYADGQQALSNLYNDQPDLIILDLLMPTIDGFEFVAKLRADPNWQAVPVVFYTANYQESEVRPLADACGVRHIINKPAEPEVIVQVLRQVLDEGDVPSPGTGSKSAGESTIALGEGDMSDFLQQHLKLLNTKLFQTVKQAVPRMDLLIDFGLQLISERDPDTLITRAASAARRLVGGRHATVLMLDEEGLLSPRVVSGLRTSERRLIRESELVKRVPEINDAEKAVRQSGPSRPAESVGLPSGHPPVSEILCVPIRVPERLFGWIIIADRVTRDAFTEEDEGLLRILMAQVARVFENSLLHAELKKHVQWLEGQVNLMRN